MGFGIRVSACPVRIKNTQETLTPGKTEIWVAQKSPYRSPHFIIMKNIELLIEEIREAERIRRCDIQMLPIVVMYETCDYQQFQKQYRDYLWGFDTALAYRKA